MKIFFSFLFTTIIQLQITAEVTIYNGNTTTQQNDAIMHATFDTTICLNYSKIIQLVIVIGPSGVQFRE